ncbi:MAG: phosphocholine cytidylyltransferase family protein [Pseudomonadota bacterium]
MTTNAVILSAGRGKRLSPLTDNKPKCLVEIGGRTILEWQLRAIAANGIDRVAIVTGFETEQVERAVDRMGLSLVPEIVFNPFHAVADNIGSCWEARERIGSDTVLMNGDTLFGADVLARLLREASAPISVTADAKAHYDADDMKIRAEGHRLTAIGKTLDLPIDGESIGLLRFIGMGGALFRTAMRDALQRSEALKRWYLSIIDALAPDGHVGVVRLQGEVWAEVDFPTDLTHAEAAVASFGSKLPTPEPTTEPTARAASGA